MAHFKMTHVFMKIYAYYSPLSTKVGRVQQMPRNAKFNQNSTKVFERKQADK
jgi:hypothetical protein